MKTKIGAVIKLPATSYLGRQIDMEILPFVRKAMNLKDGEAVVFREYANKNSVGSGTTWINVRIHKLGYGDRVKAVSRRCTVYLIRMNNSKAVRR